MAYVFNREIDLNDAQIKELLSITDNDRVKASRLIDLLHSYGDNIKKKLLDENVMLKRKNYTGEYVCKYVYSYIQKKPHLKRMQQFNDVAKELGISPKTVQKHFYKK